MTPYFREESRGYTSACRLIPQADRRRNHIYINVIREAAMGRRRVEDPKVDALREARTLNSRPESVVDEGFTGSEFFDSRDLVQVKYEMVRRVEVDGVPVAQAASGFGFSRPSYYQAAAALAQGGLPALVPARPGPRRAHKRTEQVLAHAEELLAAASTCTKPVPEPPSAASGSRAGPSGPSGPSGPQAMELVRVLAAMTLAHA